MVNDLEKEFIYAKLLRLVFLPDAGDTAVTKMAQSWLSSQLKREARDGLRWVPGAEGHPLGQRASRARGETAPQELAVTSIEALKRKGSVSPEEACQSPKDSRPPEPQRLLQATVCSLL